MESSFIAEGGAQEAPAAEPVPAPVENNDKPKSEAEAAPAEE